MVPDGKAGLVAEPIRSITGRKIIEYFKKGEGYFLPNLVIEKQKYSWDNIVEGVIN